MAMRQEQVAALSSLMPKHGPSKSTPWTGAVPDGSDSPPPAAPRTDPPQWSRWVAPAALVCALLAVVLAAWALLRPVDSNTSDPDAAPSPEAPAVTDQQAADAEARACAAFNNVRGAVVTQTNFDPDSDDPAAQEAGSANARLSLTASATYLRARLDPATPPPLAMSISAFADQLEDVAIHQLAGVPNDEPAQAARMADANAAMTQLADICG